MFELMDSKPDPKHDHEVNKVIGVQCMHRQPRHFIRQIAPFVCKRGVGRNDGASFCIKHRDAEGGILKGFGPDAQLRLTLHPFGDIANHSENTTKLTVIAV